MLGCLLMLPGPCQSSLIELQPRSPDKATCSHSQLKDHGWLVALHLWIQTCYSAEGKIMQWKEIVLLSNISYCYLENKCSMITLACLKPASTLINNWYDALRLFPSTVGYFHTLVYVIFNTSKLVIYQYLIMLILCRHNNSIVNELLGLIWLLVLYLNTETDNFAD